MYGVQNKLTHAFKARTTMRLRGKKFDALKFIAIGAAFCDFVELLPAVAGLEPSRWVRVQGSLMHPGVLLYSKCGALTIRPSGPANTPLRSVSAVH